MDLIKSILEKLKIKDIMGIIFWATLFITILPNGLLEYLSLIEFKEKYQMYISLCLILSLSYYVINILSFIKRFIFRKIHNERKVGLKYMKEEMSLDEMELLMKTFYDEENNIFKASGYIEYSDGRKSALESKFIIYRSADISNTDTIFSFRVAYNLQPYAREFLNKNLKEGSIKIKNDIVEYKLA